MWPPETDLNNGGEILNDNSLRGPSSIENDNSVDRIQQKSYGQPIEDSLDQGDMDMHNTIDGIHVNHTPEDVDPNQLNNTINVDGYGGIRRKDEYRDTLSAE